jgi:hypothetical protein
MPNMTVYTKVFFPLPIDKEYHTVGFGATIDNKKRTHHMVGHLCKNEMSNHTSKQAGEAVQPASEEENGV